MYVCKVRIFIKYKFFIKIKNKKMIIIINKNNEIYILFTILNRLISKKK